MRDLKQIQKEVENLIEFSQDYYAFHVKGEWLIQHWYEAKRPYIDRFGGETIKVIEDEISVTLSEEAKQKKIDEFFHDMEALEVLEEKTPNGLTLETFLNENLASFFDNKVVVPHPEIKILEGMKLSKCFKFFNLGISTCRMVQDIASRYMQANKVKGTLYLSVDPLDFLSISDNNSGWRSCHALDGEYRAGNLNYMIDDVTLVAYLAPKEKVQLKMFPTNLMWNNKKWRMLIHTNDFKSVCWYNRQYPFENEVLFHRVAQEVQELSHHTLFQPEEQGFKIIKKRHQPDTTFQHNYILSDQNRIYDSRDVINDKESLGYTDLCYSPHYEPWVSGPANNSEYQRVVWASDDPEEWDRAFHKAFDISIGKPCKCMKCNEEFLDREDSFLCSDCIAMEDRDEDTFLHCAFCGRRLFDIGEECWLDDHTLLCKECYDVEIQRRMDENLRYPSRAGRNLLNNWFENIGFQW